MCRQVLASWLIIVLILVGCRKAQMEDYAPERLPSIPETAVWAGWIDGGSWIECSFDSDKKANWCTAWDDQVGTVAARTFYVLQETGEGVPESELRYASFNGSHIKLADGRVLEPLKFHGKTWDLWELPPIDPPRSSTPAVESQPPGDLAGEDPGS